MNINNVVDCFTLFGAHQHDIIKYMIVMDNQPPFLRGYEVISVGNIYHAYGYKLTHVITLPAQRLSKVYRYTSSP